MKLVPFKFTCLISPSTSPMITYSTILWSQSLTVKNQRRLKSRLSIPMFIEAWNSLYLLYQLRNICYEGDILICNYHVTKNRGATGDRGGGGIGMNKRKRIKTDAMIGKGTINYYKILFEINKNYPLPPLNL